jgi:dolichol-phosphate mannosyltransferase
MDDREDVCVLIPTYNEEATIGDIVETFVEQGYTNVLVVDGHSTDDTRALAERSGARVTEQSGAGRGSGKGQAVREGIDMIDASYVLMLDGDGTYQPEDADRLLEPLFADRAEHVVGDRFADMKPGAMPRLNQVGNAVINRAFRTIHRRNYVDILSGYRAFTRESAERLNLTATGFAIETELSVECVKHSVTVEVVPITYAPRPDDSETNLDPISDGGRIVLALYRLAKTNNPLFYFGSAGVASILTGASIAAWVAYEWFVVGESHEVIATVSGVALLLGVQLLIFGVLSDMIVSLHREQLRRLRQVELRASQELSDQFDSPERGIDPNSELESGPGPDSQTDSELESDDVGDGATGHKTDPTTDSVDD